MAMPESSHGPSSFPFFSFSRFGGGFFFFAFPPFRPRERCGLSDVSGEGRTAAGRCFPRGAGPALGAVGARPAGPPVGGRQAAVPRAQPKASVRAAGKARGKSSALPRHRNAPLGRGNAVSRAPSALRWLRCLRRRPVQAGIAPCSPLPAGPTAFPPGLSSVWVFFGLWSPAFK